MTVGRKAVVLAAGGGTRLRPLTWRIPKALAPVGGRPLLDWALERVRGYAAATAVNVHHHPQVLIAHLDRHHPGVHRSVEMPIPLGTAGALGKLRGWIAGDAVLVTNADAWYPPEQIGPVLDRFVAGWDGARPRLLCVPTPQPGDFGHLRYTGTALLPWWSVATLEPAPAGLYEVSWADLHAQGTLDLVVEPGLTAIDCGTADDLDTADRIATTQDRAR